MHQKLNIENNIPMNRIYCKNCSNFLPQNAKFCRICGSQVIALEYCSCGNTIKPNTKFCGNCGKSFTNQKENPTNTSNTVTLICNCGASLKANMKFCGSCGMSVVNTQQKTDSQQTSEQKQENPIDAVEPKKEKHESEINENKAEQNDNNNICGCGAVVLANAKFCNTCGANVSRTPEIKKENVKTYITPDSPPVIPEQEKKESENFKTTQSSEQKIEKPIVQVQPTKEIEESETSENKAEQNDDNNICECGAVVLANAKFCNTCGVGISEVLEKTDGNIVSAEQSKNNDEEVQKTIGICKCGEKILESELFCASCGERIIKETPLQQTKSNNTEHSNVVSQEHYPQKSVPKKKRGVSKLAVVFIVLGISILSVLGIFLVPWIISSFDLSLPGSDKDFAPISKDGTYSFGVDAILTSDIEGKLEEKTDKSFPKSTVTLTPDQPEFRKNGVVFRINSLEGQAEVTVTPMNAPPPMHGMSVNAFRFQVDIADEYDGLYTIVLPLEGSGEIAGAGYYNENTQMWEPVYFEHDADNNQVIILTDHLSTYGSFKVDGDGTRYARIVSCVLEPHNHMSKYSNMYGPVLQEAMNRGLSPGGAAYNLGKSVVDDWFKASGVVFEMEGIFYSSEYISDLSDAFSNVGMALSIAQLAVDYSRGDQRAMAVTAFNTAQGWAISKWGTKALKVSMIGVTAIDYSLTKLREQVIEGREEGWTETYRRYYSDKGMSNTDWYYRILEISNHANSPEQFQRMFDTDLNRYVDRFWREPEVVQGEYLSDVMGQTAYGGGGKNLAMQTRISNQYKADLLLSLDPVFRRVEQEIRYQEFMEYQKELSNARELLNQLVRMEVREVKTSSNQPSRYGGYIFQLGPLPEDVDFRQWTGRLDKDGSINVSFTVLGHLAAGAPSEVRLFKNRKDFDNDKPAHVQQIEISVPLTVVELTMDDCDGIYEGQIKISTPELVELGMSETTMDFVITITNGIMEMEYSHEDGISMDLGGGMKIEQTWTTKAKLEGTCDNGLFNGKGTQTGSVTILSPDPFNPNGPPSKQTLPSPSSNVNVEGVIKENILEGDYFFSFEGKEYRYKFTAKRK